VLVKLKDMGVTVTTFSDDPETPGLIRIAATERCNAVDIMALPHPGFPTDMQQPMVALLSVSEGSSMVTDRVFESRFRYVDELNRMGADIRVEGRTAFVHGVDHLRGATVEATDLRAGAALIVAALGAEGESVVTGVQHVDRGYSELVEKLQAAGACISRGNMDTEARELSLYS
jgi:UDP-N-acetylglucosamine 1-carboxyvinyltransferase